MITPGWELMLVMVLTPLSYYREFGAVGNNLDVGAGRTARRMDKNDPHGLYLQRNSGEQYNDRQEHGTFTVPKLV